MKKLLFAVSVLFVFGCESKKEDKVETLEYKMYKQSEMAALMLQMYSKSADNKRLVLEGKTPKDFPEDFFKIHTAQLTDPSDRTTSFKTFSDLYLTSYQQVFKTPKDSLVAKHNSAINSCIACHKTTCIGPIPKIKKLLIQ
jgi:hypothetical protein